MLAWSRRCTIIVLAGAIALAPLSTHAAFAAPAAKRSARAERQEVRQGALLATLSRVHELLAQALALVSSDPAPSSSTPPSGPSGDNGAGIDPNGS